VPCRANGPHVEVRGKPTFMTIEAMRAAVETSRLGPPKAASEGAERDRSWPATVPGDDGTVLAVEKERIKTSLRSGRNQTYNIVGKAAYVKAGDTFTGDASIIAGTLPRLADLANYRDRRWDPAEDLRSDAPTDRYAAAKALALRTDIREARQLLVAALDREGEHRTALEIAGAAARLASDKGMDHLRTAVFNPDARAPEYLPMEAVFIMSELPSSLAAGTLAEIAGTDAFRQNEVRQAAAWGLGKNGCKAYEHLVPFLDDAEDDFLMHVIAAFGQDTPRAVIRSLADALVAAGNDRMRSSLSATLVQIGSNEVAAELVARATSPLNPWLVATIGQLPRASMANLTVPEMIKIAMEPVRMLSVDHNWLAETTVDTNFQFLVQQNL
jgi:PBS lyase HEAT-like repeat-containing protein